MAICSKLKDFLDSNEVCYKTISHPQAFTMQEKAAVSHISGRCVAKTVVVKANGNIALAVLPATSMLDFNAIAALMGVAKVTLATEEELAETFAECELGAYCPFGHLYEIPIYMDDDMWMAPKMAFNAGSHRELVEMEVDDYCRLANPEVGPIGREGASRLISRI